MTEESNRHSITPIMIPLGQKLPMVLESAFNNNNPGILCDVHSENHKNLSESASVCTPIHALKKNARKWHLEQWYPGEADSGLSVEMAMAIVSMAGGNHSAFLKSVVDFSLLRDSCLAGAATDPVSKATICLTKTCSMVMAKKKSMPLLDLLVLRPPSWLHRIENHDVVLNRILDTENARKNARFIGVPFVPFENSMSAHQKLAHRREICRDLVFLSHVHESIHYNMPKITSTSVMSKGWTDPIFLED